MKQRKPITRATRKNRTDFTLRHIKNANGEEELVFVEIDYSRQKQQQDLKRIVIGKPEYQHTEEDQVEYCDPDEVIVTQDLDDEERAFVESVMMEQDALLSAQLGLPPIMELEQKQTSQPFNPFSQSSQKQQTLSSNTFQSEKIFEVELPDVVLNVREEAATEAEEREVLCDDADFDIDLTSPIDDTSQFIKELPKARNAIVVGINANAKRALLKDLFGDIDCDDEDLEDDVQNHVQAANEKKEVADTLNFFRQDYEVVKNQGLEQLKQNAEIVEQLEGDEQNESFESECSLPSHFSDDEESEKRQIKKHKRERPIPTIQQLDEVPVDDEVVQAYVAQLCDEQRQLAEEEGLKNFYKRITMQQSKPQRLEDEVLVKGTKIQQLSGISQDAIIQVENIGSRTKFKQQQLKPDDDEMVLEYQQIVFDHSSRRGESKEEKQQRKAEIKLQKQERRQQKKYIQGTFAKETQLNQNIQIQQQSQQHGIKIE